MNKEVLFEGKFLKVFKDQHWEFVQRHNCTGIVVILAVTDDAKIIFTRQYRLPVHNHVIELPAGLVGDHGSKRKELMVTAARRELFEETGYIAKRFIRLVSGPVSGGLSSDIMTLYWAKGLKKKGKGGGDLTENITTFEVPVHSAHAWLRTMEKKGNLVDPKVYAGLYFLNKSSEFRVKSSVAARVLNSEL